MSYIDYISSIHDI